MKATVIHGQLHHGSTYHITKSLINNLNVETDEFFMSKDGPSFCIGCYKCFFDSIEKCPTQNNLLDIIKSIETSDIIIIDSPTYCFGVTGQLKTFLDHLGFMWMSHRPNPLMFKKIGIVISTASGAGSKKTTKFIKQNMNWMGLSTVFTYNKNVSASSWHEVNSKTKEKIKKDINSLSKKIIKSKGKATTKVKGIFHIMRLMQKNNSWNKVDYNHWKDNGWLDKKRPW